MENYQTRKETLYLKLDKVIDREVTYDQYLGID